MTVSSAITLTSTVVFGQNVRREANRRSILARNSARPHDGWLHTPFCGPLFFTGQDWLGGFCNRLSLPQQEHGQKALALPRAEYTTTRDGDLPRPVCRRHHLPANISTNNRNPRSAHPSNAVQVACANDEGVCGPHCDLGLKSHQKHGGHYLLKGDGVRREAA